ncbi:SDR family oxidoreductase [Streptomyces sp. NPDC023838]
MIAHVAAGTPLPDAIRAEDVADAVVVLAGDLSRKVTGTFLPLDGGRTPI